MILSEIKQKLKDLETLKFQLPDGRFVPAHFHVTEIGEITKNYIDCGGTVRREKSVNFQLLEAEDFDHNLVPQKLLSIIALSEKVLQLGNSEIEVEYQTDTIGKYGLDFNGEHFLLTTKATSCLARDNCGIPKEKEKIELAGLKESNSCSPGGGCC